MHHMTHNTISVRATGVSVYPCSFHCSNILSRGHEMNGTRVAITFLKYVFIFLLSITAMVLVLYEYHSPTIPALKPKFAEYHKKKTSCFIMPAFIRGSTGPQNNFKRLADALVAARYRNCSIATYPIPVHKTQDNGSTARSWSDTFDVKGMERTSSVPIISPQLFHEHCNGKAAFSICTARKQLNFKNITDKLQSDIGLSFVIDNDTNKGGFGCDTFLNATCVITIDTVLPKASRSLQKTVGIFFNRAAYIQDIATNITNTMCKGKPYIAFHWRNRTGERCDIWYTNKNRSLCDFKLLTLQNSSKQLVKVIKNYMNKEKLLCMYIAFPPFTKRILDIIGDNIPNYFTKQDIINLVPDIAKYKDDNYVISLVEQEIAIRAAKFIGCRGSAWTNQVVKGRTQIRKKSVMINSLPGVPRDVIRIN